MLLCLGETKAGIGRASIFRKVSTNIKTCRPRTGHEDIYPSYSPSGQDSNKAMVTCTLLCYTDKHFISPDNKILQGDMIHKCVLVVKPKKNWIGYSAINYYRVQTRSPFYR
jgi:hypothetical protein